VDGLSERDLVDRSGVPAERVRRFVELGILQPGPEGFRAPNVQLARLYVSLEEAGYSPEMMGKLIESGAWSNAWADLIFPNPHPYSEQTLGEFSDELGLPRSFTERIYASSQLPFPGWDQRVREDEAEYLRIMATIYEGIGRDEDAALTPGRITGESTRRIAQVLARFFRSTVEEPLFGSGIKMSEAIQTVAQVGGLFMDRAERGLLILYNRHLEDRVFEDVVLNLDLTLEREGIAQRAPERCPAIAFMDLSGFTSLTEREGDESAAQLAAQLAEMVQGAANRHRGHVVKLLGDGVMFHFPRAADAVVCGLDLVEEAPSRGLPKARVGIDSGPVIFRDADYFGRTVNVAARVTDYARPAEVLATSAVAGEDSPEGISFSEIGEVGLKGLSGPVRLSRAERS
jgi:adenylate cyclase